MGGGASTADDRTSRLGHRQAGDYVGRRGHATSHRTLYRGVDQTHADLHRPKRHYRERRLRFASPLDRSRQPTLPTSPPPRSFGDLDSFWLRGCQGCGAAIQLGAARDTVKCSGLV